MRSIAPTVLAAAVAGALLLPVASRADDSSFRILVDDADGSRVDIQLPAGWITGLLAATTVDCDSDVDSRTERMALALDRKGEGGVYTYVDDQGRDVVARRSRGQLKIETTDDRGERASVDIPWALAECLMLGREPEEGLGRALARDGVHIRIRGDEDGHGRDGGHVHIDLDVDDTDD